MPEVLRLCRILYWVLKLGFTTIRDLISFFGPRFNEPFASGGGEFFGSLCLYCFIICKYWLFFLAYPKSCPPDPLFTRPFINVSFMDPRWDLGEFYCLFFSDCRLSLIFFMFSAMKLSRCGTDLWCVSPRVCDIFSSAITTEALFARDVSFFLSARLAVWVGTETTGAKFYSAIDYEFVSFRYDFCNISFVGIVLCKLPLWDFYPCSILIYV